MSTITWVTNKGNLGTIPESLYYSYSLEAIDSDEQILVYSLVSGDLPGGMYVSRLGKIQGIPSIQSPVVQSLTYAFTIRATNPQGKVADRSFSLIVSNVNGPQIFPKPDLVGAWFDGNYLEYQFDAINDNSAAEKTWSILNGTLPPGVTLSETGLLSGYVDIIEANTTDLGYEAQPVDALKYDVLPQSTDTYYNFTLQVTDGVKFDSVNVRLLIVSKGNYTADNFITNINNTFIRVDADNKYRPIIINIPEVTETITYGAGASPLNTFTVDYNFPTLTSGDTFAYKLIAYDPEDADISWAVNEEEFSGLDELDIGRRANVFFGTSAVGSVGPYTIDRTLSSAFDISVRINGIYLEPITDYTVAGDDITFTNFVITGASRTSDEVTITVGSHVFSVGDTVRIVGVSDASFNGTFVVTSKTATTIVYNQEGANATSSGGTVSKYAPTLVDDIEIYYIELGTYPIGRGFDTLLFDQGIEGLPAGITIEQDTGWMYGVLPPQVEEEKIYTLTVQAYRTLTPDVLSDPATFKFKVKRTVNEEIIWTSPSVLGTIDNGGISEISLNAYNNYGKELQYSLTYNPYRKVPQGLKLLSTGRFIGRVTFRYFSLDGQQGTITLETTEDIEVGMTVQGVGVAAGCSVTQIVDSTTIIVSPSIYVTQGAILTFSNENTTTVQPTTTNAISTAIDGGRTTFDQDCYFTAKAEAIDGSISSTKNFKITIRPRNLAPYENLWLKNLPSEAQRKQYKDLIEDESIFPPSVIYRPDDPYFGVSKSMKIMFLSGLSPAQITDYTTLMEQNHYTKTIQLGDIKTARAIDSNGQTVYEVVYVEAVDTQEYDTPGPTLQKTLSVANGYLYNGNEYKTIKPNSFNNMQYRVDTGIGYTNRGALPRWMTSVQENGLVLGLTRAIVIAYVQPGAGKLVQYRLRTSDKWLDGVFSFIADRYQWENFLSKFYDVENATFLTSRETTFDKYNLIGESGQVVNTATQTAVTNSNVISIGLNLSIGEGWSVTSLDTRSQIPEGTYITSVVGNVITLSAPITALAFAGLKISGIANVDYAVSKPFNVINGATRSYLRTTNAIDGVQNFTNNQLIVFAQQFGFANDPENNGFIDENGNYIPGFLDKLSGVSTVNRQAGVYRMILADLPTVRFDEDGVGFDGPSFGFINGYFEQDNEIEIRLEFVQEVLVNQPVKVRTGRTYPTSTLQYKLAVGEAVPRYVPVVTTTRTAETTFDGGSCICRESDLDKRTGIRGGTGFFTNRDKFEIPESQDKYIKFPQNGVFV